MVVKLIVFMATLAMALPTYAATVTTAPPSGGQSFQYIYVNGVIVGGDDAALGKALASASTSGTQPVVMLDSRGGDVDVSMAMGRSIRRHKAITYHGHCASSCVFAFLGGVQRFTANENESAKLIVHRPELGEAYVHHPTPFGKKMMNMLRDYMTEMTGGSGLYDTMMTIPFGAPRALSPDEAIRLGAITPRGRF